MAGIAFLFWAVAITLASALGAGIVTSMLRPPAPGCGSALAAILIYTIYSVMVALVFSLIDADFYGSDPFGLSPAAQQSGGDAMMELFAKERNLG